MPTPEEMNAAQQAFGLHASAVEDALGVHERPYGVGVEQPYGFGGDN
jgi:Mg2+ and Co2+ transporter CorA